MNSHIPEQSTFFYRGKWIREMDTLLLSTMIKMKNDRGWNGASVPYEVFHNVRKVINPRFGVALTCEDLAIRLKLLEARYNTFKYVVATHGVRQWRIHLRIVAADDSTWKLIFQRNAYAAAYYHSDEPEFNFMVTMFGFHDVKVEVSHEVISLSDNTEVIVITDSAVPNAPILGRLYASPADPDEVTLPMSGPATRVHRKLFDMSGPCFDELSSNKSPARFIPAKEISWSPKGSSCASWSPFPTSCKTAP
ncbi:hypothetical protein AAHA92_10358 [Salvia divinorum]|uniref:Myb/SANT-like domain-containing protein n=1 Tax=Salvia divinorum TaxID=28513 RepID=A0ABD1HV41_SALDI